MTSAARVSLAAVSFAARAETLLRAAVAFAASLSSFSGLTTRKDVEPGVSGDCTAPRRGVEALGAGAESPVLDLDEVIGERVRALPCGVPPLLRVGLRGGVRFAAAGALASLR